MKTLARIIVTIAAAATFTACAVEPDASDSKPAVSVWEISADTPLPTAVPPVPMSGDVLVLDDPTTDDGQLGICACDTPECEIAMVEENFGCGVCAAVNCGQHTAGGCVLCDDHGQVAATDATTDRAW